MSVFEGGGIPKPEKNHEKSVSQKCHHFPFKAANLYHSFCPTRQFPVDLAARCAAEAVMNLKVTNPPSHPQNAWRNGLDGGGDDF